MNLGDTFLLGQGSHLYIVISDPAKHDDHFIIVNLTTDDFRAGKECVLNRGDHQWCTKPYSYVTFGDARVVNPKEEALMNKHLASGAMRRHFPMKSSILQKIIAAAKASKAMPEEFKAYLL
jgi:hypothetical protein